ncbi:rhamnogalacturonan acetylesterase [Adhaeribacter rhizoryzae]|uniref:Rhamnogalacturonan acetylesterase n=1 Tax=Adhaeribacter rhizoryzae TaxID=2607907 RepID=A0A5M6D641_9BACT|nr:rhamnogalacturonan acetylesterase [Adhaeribacter rhizoryzae]KAA5542951.1 rhamnogalacturonan acetylesterase [Adhaeribacter rhizoryzae]
MKTTLFKTTCFFTLLCLMAFAWPQQKKLKVYLIGDSTMAIKETKAYPETGWGMPFSYFFDNTAEVDNRAKNGRSTKTFIAEGLWQPVADNLQAGDYVFIQFGHNDEVKTKKSYSTEEEFQTNLKRYVTETRRKKAIPILFTPVARRKFDEQGKIVGTHEVYAELVRKVAKAEKVPLIDMDVKSQALLQQFGPETSKLLFLQLAPGEHPNYPDGKDDNTHFSELGARLMAQLVYTEIKNLNLDLASRFAKPQSN